MAPFVVENKARKPSRWFLCDGNPTQLLRTGVSHLLSLQAVSGWGGGTHKGVGSVDGAETLSFIWGRVSPPGSARRERGVASPRREFRPGFGMKRPRGRFVGVTCQNGGGAMGHHHLPLVKPVGLIFFFPFFFFLESSQVAF